MSFNHWILTIRFIFKVAKYSNGSRISPSETPTSQGAPARVTATFQKIINSKWKNHGSWRGDTCTGAPLDPPMKSYFYLFYTCQRKFFLWEVNIRETIVPIEVNNDTYWFPKTDRKVPAAVGFAIFFKAFPYCGY